MSSQVKEDLYGVSWSNPAWSHFLCSANVLDYFCDLSNPFYDRQCNNEVIRMQRLHPEQLLCMTGIEFYLHHAQEPILFIIRKQQRLSPTQVTPLAYYYVINGTVLQAPDLSTLLNSRLLTAIVGLKKVIQTLGPCARYHPSDGSYSWDDPNVLLGYNKEPDQTYAKSQSTSNTERDLYKSANLFQVQRTDTLLADWMNRFPVPSASFIQNLANSGQTSSVATVTSAVNASGVVSLTSAQTASSIKEENLQINCNSPAKLPTRLPTLPGVSVVPGPSPSTSTQPSLPVDRKPRV
ncbi:med-6-related [Schistosoma mansoni]|uniref:Mediator of RNA polymerase II transcription subunit 6 n=1 Tax=Schistosoma mansoni TaxID=6183 RepID=G4V7I9_SCHMA|nr:med-6-related [Schistosoma mansoni]|eukprot:XP_018648858.1 med-6-related [Schistosoma mansoni]